MDWITISELKKINKKYYLRFGDYNNFKIGTFAENPSATHFTDIDR